MRGIIPLVVRLLLLIIIPGLSICAYSVYIIIQSLPQAHGVAPSPSLKSSVVIQRDHMGVPIIQADTDKEAFYALGYAHAQDRLWQLEVQKRLTAGRLSEIFGKESVGVDTFFRTLNLNARAEKDIPYLSKPAITALESYRNGINDFVASNPTLPVEFQILGIKPDKWKISDSLAWIKVLALNLGGNYKDEINRLVVSQYLNEEQLAELAPGYPNDGYTSINTQIAKLESGLKAVSNISDLLEQQFQLGGKFVGSNAWVVAPQHSQSGGALLATDPHMGLQAPSMWYMATLKGDTLNVSGATVVGLPVIVFGKNQNIAWSGTNLMADVQDIFIEQVKADDKTKYRYQGEWHTFSERTEYITVKQDFPEILHGKLKPVTVKIRESIRGPIINDLVAAVELPASLSWTVLKPGDTSFESLFRLNYAKNWTEFSDSLGLLVAPALNFVYADQDGNIGYRVGGKIPIRNGWEGQLPVPGWDEQYVWKGYIPNNELPAILNPSAGYIVSANNKPIDDSYPYFISHSWAPPTRSERIADMIEEHISKGQKLDLNNFKQMQHDTLNASAYKMLELLLKVEPTNEQQRQAHEILKAWNGEMRADSAAPTIVNVWLRNLRKELIQDELKENWNNSIEKNALKDFVHNMSIDTLYSILQTPDSQWCDDVRTDEVETCADAIDASLKDTLWEIYKVTGNSNLSQWHWGELHQAVYKHQPFSSVNFLKDLFTLKMSSEGSPNSVSVADFNYRKSSGYDQYFGATFKQLFDMNAKQNKHLYMNVPGQSGNVASSHYNDMLKPFHSGEYQSMPETVDTEKNVLTLVPIEEVSGE